jgi:hypothetical protein
VDRTEINVADIKPTNVRRTSDEIIQYKLGKPGEIDCDFTYEYIETVILDCAKWWAKPESGRKYADPIQMAREKIRECLLGLKPDGTVWDTAPNDFRKRVKIKCNYDIKAKKGVPVKQRRRKLEPEAAEGAKQLHGMTPVSSSVDIEAVSTQYVEDILSEFPELDNAAHLPNVESLADVYTQRKVISNELKFGVKGAVRTQLLEQLKTIETMADSMMNKLGIHPNQVRKKLTENANSSIADLVSQIDEDTEFREREKQWSLQLALQFWWMSEHNNYRQDGPNVSDFEIWHATRSRPIRHKCSCGRETLLVDGFEPLELRDLLVKEGVLVEVPVIGLFTSEELRGLATAGLEVTHEETIAG